MIFPLKNQGYRYDTRRPGYSCLKSFDFPAELEEPVIGQLNRENPDIWRRIAGETDPISEK
ncbi:MAG: hypothetical protein ACLSVG_10570 [Clostridia bacterium]